MGGVMNYAAVLVVSGLFLQAPAAQQQPEERGRTQGLKETDEFVKAGNRTTSAVADAKQQTQKTLDAYNALVTQPSKNMKGDYKKLMKSMDGMNDRVADARKKVDEMQQAGATYFAGRAETIKGIQDASLQTRARDRLADSQKQFEGVLKSLKEAADAMEPFRKQLADQITYLGSDLTPSAMTSLKPNADKLNTTAAELFGKTDTAISHANAYFDGLKSAQS
jgi:predicted  nucleic acid-binding Zn-ribbon protein